MSNSRNDHLANWFEYGVDYRRRMVRISDDIDEVSVDYAISGLLALDASPGDILVRLSTYGGDWWPGMALYDAIKALNSHVTIVGTGYVMSMGTVILQAADTRLLTPNTDLMIHYGYDGFEGSALDMKRYAKKGEQLDRLMEAIYFARIKEKHPNFTREDLKKLLSNDTYLTAKEAVALGLADGVEE